MIEPKFGTKFVKKAKMYCAVQNFNESSKTDKVEWFSTQEEAEKRRDEMEKEWEESKIAAQNEGKESRR